MKKIEVKDLTTCFDYLKENVIDYKEFGNFKENDIVLYHHNLGKWIRNHFELWAECQKNDKSDFVAWFNELGIYHPDDMSGIILTSFHRHLNNKKLKLKKQIKHYRKHWDKYDSNVNKGIFTN